MVAGTQAIQFLQQENTRLRQKLEELQEENNALESFIKGITALQQAALTIAGQDNLLRLLDEILYQALVVINTDHGSILLTDEEAEELVFVLVHGSLRDSLQGYRMPWHQGIAGSTVKSKQPAIVNHTRFDPRFSKEVDQAFGIKSDQLIAVPMLYGEKVVGVIELVNKTDGSPFSESDATLLSLLATFAALSLTQLEHRLKLEETGSLA